MMRQLLEGGSLTSRWRCIGEGRGTKENPTLLLMPSVRLISYEVAGEASVRDIDGKEWRASYSTKEERTNIYKDFDTLSDGVAKAYRGGS